jgi:hypothetical protein
MGVLVLGGAHPTRVVDAGDGACRMRRSHYPIHWPSSICWILLAQILFVFAMSYIWMFNVSLGRDFNPDHLDVRRRSIGIIDGRVKFTIAYSTQASNLGPSIGTGIV